MRDLYYVRTNGYDIVISDDGETRRIFNDVGDVKIDYEDYLKTIEDDSSWEQYSETFEQLTEYCKILAYQTVVW